MAAYEQDYYAIREALMTLVPSLKTRARGNRRYVMSRIKLEQLTPCAVAAVAAVNLLEMDARDIHLMGFFLEHKEPLEPTDYFPGTYGKIVTMASRVSKGYKCFHPEDTNSRLGKYPMFGIDDD